MRSEFSTAARSVRFFTVGEDSPTRPIHSAFCAEAASTASRSAFCTVPRLLAATQKLASFSAKISANAA